MKLKFLLILILLFSCKKEVIPDPEVVILSSPGNGDFCTTALNIDLEESQVTFSWNQSLHTDSYEININNLDNGEIILRREVKIDNNDTEHTLADKILKEEHLIYPEAIKLVLKK